MNVRNVFREIKSKLLLEWVGIIISREKRYLNNLPYDPMPIFRIVKEHIDQWDPVHLLAMECPPDEYEPEIRQITIYITKHFNDLDENSLERRIHIIFKKAFDEEFNENNRSMEVASNIIKALETNKFIMEG